MFTQYLKQQIYPEGQESANLKINKKIAILNSLQIINKKVIDTKIDASTDAAITLNNEFEEQELSRNFTKNMPKGFKTMTCNK